MARGDVHAPARAHFDESREIVADQKPQTRVYRCTAHGCPMPGAIFLNGHDAPGICAWHYGANGSAFPRITQALQRWECISLEVTKARQVVNDPAMATDVKAQDAALRAAWARMLPAVEGSGWENALAPRKGEAYGDWGRSLTDFLVGRINAEVSGTSGEVTQTTTVRDMHSRLRGSIGNAEGFAA